MTKLTEAFHEFKKCLIEGSGSNDPIKLITLDDKAFELLRKDLKKCGVEDPHPDKAQLMGVQFTRE